MLPSLPLQVSALAPPSTAANTALRWTATRHHESLQNFLRTNSTLSQELDELKFVQNKNTLIKDEADSMVKNVREEMVKTVASLSAQLESQIGQLARQQSELDAKGLKITELKESGASSAAVLVAEIEALNGKVADLKVENGDLRSKQGDVITDMERLGILNEELELENKRLNENNSTKQTTINALQKTLHDLKAVSSKNGSELEDAERQWRKAMEDQKISLMGDNKRRLNQLEEEMMLLKREIENMKNQNAAMERKVERGKVSLIKEREGRESAQEQFKITINSLQKDLETSRASHTLEVERLNSIIFELRRKFSDLEGQPKEIVPDGSKFSMFVDLKTKNAKLAKQLRVEKDRALVSGSGISLRRTSRGRPEDGESSTVAMSSSANMVGRSGGKRRPKEVNR